MTTTNTAEKTDVADLGVIPGGDWRNLDDDTIARLRAARGRLAETRPARQLGKIIRMADELRRRARELRAHLHSGCRCAFCRFAEHNSEELGLGPFEPFLGDHLTTLATNLESFNIVESELPYQIINAPEPADENEDTADVPTVV